MIKYNQEYEEELLDIVKSNPKNYVKVIKSTGFKGRCPNRQYLRDYICQCTPLLDEKFGFKYALRTRLYWTLNHIQDWDDPRVKCAVCGTPFKKIDIWKIEVGYKRKTCCKDCERKLAYESFGDRLEEKYGEGVRNPYQIPGVIEDFKRRKDEIQRKRDQTRIEHFGIENNGWNTKKSIQTRIDRYGSPWNQKQVWETKIERYGDRGFNNPEKNLQTKIANKTFNTSSQEEIAYKILCNKYGKENVARQFKSKKYPFACDFYVKTEDLYIECNFTWTHGGHWFDPSNEKDIEVFQKWKDKGTKYYLNAIETWTSRDVKKRNAVKTNNINYLVFWTLEEVQSFYKTPVTSTQNKK